MEVLEEEVPPRQPRPRRRQPPSLGLDVHDTPSVDSGTPLEGGMVITVEPGLYIPADDARVTSCRRVRHPETLLACAMASADVCGRNLTAARAL